MRERGSDTGSYRNLGFHREPEDSRPGAREQEKSIIIFDSEHVLGTSRRPRDHRSRLQLQRNRNDWGHIWRLTQKFVGRLRSIASSAQSIFSRYSICARCLQLFARIFCDESGSTNIFVGPAGILFAIGRDSPRRACRLVTRLDATLPHRQDACVTMRLHR